MEKYMQNGGGGGYSYPIRNLLKTNNTDPKLMTGGGGERNYASYENLAIPMGLINEAFNRDLKSWKRCGVAGIIDDATFDNMFSMISEKARVNGNISKKNRHSKKRTSLKIH
jgi:hypothetical protein